MSDQDFIKIEFRDKKIMADGMYMRFVSFAIEYLSKGVRFCLSKNKPVCVHCCDYVRPWLIRSHCKYRTVFWKKVNPSRYRCRCLLGRFFFDPISAVKAYLRLSAAKWRRALCR